MGRVAAWIGILCLLAAVPVGLVSGLMEHSVGVGLAGTIAFALCGYIWLLIPGPPRGQRE